MTKDIRFNMSVVFMWFAVFSLGLYISYSINLWVGLFLVWAMITANLHQTPASGEALLSVILGSILYFVFYNVFNKQWFIAAFCIFAVVNLLFLIAQLLEWDIVLKSNHRLSLPQMRMGILENRNSLAAAFAFCLPAMISERRNWNIVSILLIVSGLIMAKTVGGVLASIPTLFYFAYMWTGKYAVLLAIAGVLMVGAYIQFVDIPDWRTRWACWRMYGELKQAPYVVMNKSEKEYIILKQNDFMGVGLGHWRGVFTLKNMQTNKYPIGDQITKWTNSRRSRPMLYAQAHNEFIQVDFEMGKIGLFIIIGYLANVLYRVRHIKDPRPALMLISFIIVSMVYFPVHIPLLAIVIIMGLVWLEKESQCFCFS